MSVDRLCFGTSTFVAGKLYPDKDSRPGIAALREALDAGVRLIHSNPGLGTQWAVRKAIADAGHPHGIRHLVKVEIRLDLDEAEIRSVVRRALALSRKNLGADHLHAAVIEPDIKRTACRRCLVDNEKLTRFYELAAEEVSRSGEASEAFSFSHSPAHLAASLCADLITGCATQYNMVEGWPALYLDRIAESGRTFTAMAPLRRGALIDPLASSALDRLKPLRWVLGHPAVTHTTVTMSSPIHAAEVPLAAVNPLPVSEVHIRARSWQVPIVPGPDQKK